MWLSGTMPALVHEAPVSIASTTDNGAGAVREDCRGQRCRPRPCSYRT